MGGAVSMKIIRHAKRYYLKKINNGELTNWQVANILNISVNMVNDAYYDYCKEKNPLKRKSFEFKNATIQIVISITSTIIVLFTLFEMQTSRNSAYLPNISLQGVKAAISWDSNGLPFANKEIEENISKLIKDEDVIINSPPKLKIYNTGVGTARDISFVWNNQNNIKSFMGVLNSYKDIDISFVDDMFYMKTSAAEFGMSVPNNNNYDFLLNSTQEYDTLFFPYVYFELIRETYFRNNEKTVPPIVVTIFYSDVQGKIYSKKMQIKSNLYFLEQNKDGSGYCIFSLTSEKENTTINASDFLNINSDNLIAITSVCAVLISIISIILTIIFSKLQIKHNVNSVRPISAIKFNDYEDEIAVKIQNVGTGPLLIKKLIFKNSFEESSTLIEMMPNINQPWSTYTECVDGWTIPVGGQLIILRLYPATNEVKTLVRKKLSPITVYLEYSDIYNNKFYDERSLNFFSRHFE